MAKKRLKEILNDLEEVHILRNRLDMLFVGSTLVSSAIAAESMVLTGLRGTASRSELIGIKRLFEKEFGRMEAAANRCCDLTDALLEEAIEELEIGFPDPIQRIKGKKSKIVQGEIPTPKDLQKGFIQ